jgi:hypothetical protein
MDGILSLSYLICAFINGTVRAYAPTQFLIFYGLVPILLKLWTPTQEKALTQFTGNVLWRKKVGTDSVLNSAQKTEAWSRLSIQKKMCVC